MAKSRNRDARHVRLYHWLMASPAWQDLDAIARAVYVDMASRYAGDGSNNGRIPYSVREAVGELNISKATASRALTRLADHGFIVATTKGAFSLKKRHATEWRLTEFPSDLKKGEMATKDFMKWTPQPGGSLASALPSGALREPPRLRVIERHSPGKLVVSL